LSIGEFEEEGDSYVGLLYFNSVSVAIAGGVRVFHEQVLKGKELKDRENQEILPRAYYCIPFDTKILLARTYMLSNNQK
jgi:hypothetical protein